MEPNKTAIERAFELARTGLFLEVGEIKDRLRREGYYSDIITGPLLREQLKSLIAIGTERSRKAELNGHTKRPDEWASRNKTF